MPEQQYIPPDPRRAARQAIVQQASLKYLRAAQVAADAVYMMFNTLAQRNLLVEQAAALTIGAVPAIVEAVLADEDITDPQEEELWPALPTSR